MNLFIDTEFTDFSRPDLISIGIVSEDGREFYGERGDFLQVRCTDFVREIVLPQLGQMPDKIYTLPELKAALLAWLAAFKTESNVTICSDLENDWEQFTKLLGNDLPKWITYKSIEGKLFVPRLQYYFAKTELKEHHALNDARAICHVFTTSPKKLTDEERFFELPKIILKEIEESGKERLTTRDGKPLSIIENKKIELEAKRIHKCLTFHSNKLEFEHRVENLFERKQNQELITACQHFGDYASFISARFDFFSQLSPLDAALFEAYKDVSKSKQPNPTRTTESSLQREWGAFRDRLMSDNALLSEIAPIAKRVLQRKVEEKGKPSKPWKNELFTRCFDRLSKFLDGSQLERAKLATKIWGLYFENDRFEISPKSALRVVDREHLRTQKIKRH